MASILVGGVSTLFGPPDPASAHAAVVSTAPQQRSVLNTVPSQVVLTFTEPIRLVPDKVQVLAPDGKRISVGDPTVVGRTLTIPLRKPDRPLGSYLVSYRVISADSHPVAGGYSFSVGAPSASVPQPVSDVDPVVRAMVPVAKYLGYAGLVLVIGPALLLALLWPRRASRRGPVLLVRSGLGLLAAGTMASLWLQAPAASGATIFDVSGADLVQVIFSSFGVALLVRLGVLAVVAVELPPVLAGRASRSRAAVVGALGVIGLLTWPLSGHAVASPMPPVTVAADAVHLAAMAVWLGGLVTLVGFLLRRRHARALAVILPVWSRWAALAVCWLVAAGGVQALTEMGTPRAVIDTAYGRLLVLKVALLILIVAAAAYARRMVRHRTAATAPAGLRRTVGVELGLTAVVLAVSAMLVQTTPGRTALVEADSAAWDGFAQTLTSPLYTLQFDVYPAQVGENNTVHAFVYTAEGKPLPVKEWRLTAALPADGVEPVTNHMLGVEPSHGVGAVSFPRAGQWQLRFTIRVSDIDQASVVTTVPVK